MAIVRGEICGTRAALNKLSSSPYSLHLKLAQRIRSDPWSIIDASAALKVEKEGYSSQER